MTEIRTELRFILNGRDVVLSDVPATRTLLDYLRLDCGLKGSKEGCAEGDCGACTVLVGKLDAAGRLAYETVTACITFMGQLDGAHIVTIEHLSPPEGPLHPVQQAMVDYHGSQCGFCTPGIVMSLYSLWMRNPQPSGKAVETALQGNLCRCTGYNSIFKAAKAVSNYGRPEADTLVTERDGIIARLKALRDGKRVELGAGKARIIIPASVDDLASVYLENPTATIVSGATDVGLWVTKFMRDIGPLIFIGDIAGLQGIGRDGDRLVIGAGVTYTRARAEMVAAFPQLAELWDRIAGEQIRNRGTIGANIANGSPIGDTPPPLIALGAEVTLNRGGVRRTLPLESFFIAYGKQDRQPGEFVESVSVPLLPEGEHFACYKLSKRRDEDISSACGAFRVKLDGDGKVVSARIAFGGMAATPKRAKSVEAALVGQPWTEAGIGAAIAAFGTDYQPLTDMRATAEYRLTAAQNLLKRFLLETTGSAERLVREVA